jgi:hypothetical protein
MRYIPPEQVHVENASSEADEYVRCTRCGYTGCDVRVSSCNCTFHAVSPLTPLLPPLELGTPFLGQCLSNFTNFAMQRCIPLSHGSGQHCPHCGKPVDTLVLFPVSFREIDEALRTALVLSPSSAVARNRKRKGTDDVLEAVNPLSSFAERRTGRWTVEEMAYCDKLIAKFSLGELPLPDSVKLNEFLGNMLKSKQSRLTKKMKNAKLSTKTYKRKTGCIDPADAREVSNLEESFFNSIVDFQERAEVKFHMQKEWREQFSKVCADLGRPLDADAWLSSVEEMDRRSSKARDSARMAKRKLMMGVALRADTKNLEQGVFIEKTEAEVRVVAASQGSGGGDEKDFERDLLFMLSEDKNQSKGEQSSLLHSAPFLAKVTAYLMRHSVPFEHVDLWVPSFVPGDETQGGTACRLCYAGNSTTDKLVTEDGLNTRPLTPEEKFNFYSFGDYSQKFSFNVGCGLPGRVYESGRPTWEQSVNNAPDHHFERCGGAKQWEIKSVVGLLVASPNVGRIVVVLYSRFDRPKDEGLVIRLCDEFTKVCRERVLPWTRQILCSHLSYCSLQLMPSPKWKLVVDIGEIEDIAPPAPAEVPNVEREPGDTESFSAAVSAASGNDGAPRKDSRIEHVVALLGKYMPSDPMSPLAPYVSGFMSLRLLLLRVSRSPEEEELVRTMMDSYSSYAAGGREQADIAVMLARDFLFLSGNSPAFS